MKIKCGKCGHVWLTRKEKVPVACSYCKTSMYFHQPIILKE